MRRTITHLFAEQAGKYGGRLQYFRWRDGHWQPVSFRQAWDRARAVGLGLWSLGCRKEDAIGILAPTSADWLCVDIAGHVFGARIVGLYPTCTPEEAAYILEHAECVAVCVQDAEQLAQVQSFRGRLPKLAHIIVFDPPSESGDWISLADLEAAGRELGEREPELADTCCDAVQPEDVATIVYTSGTTGPPKGVVLTHANLFDISDSVHQGFDLDEHDVGVVALPLAHSLQRVAVYAGLRAGSTGRIARSLEEIGEAWQLTKPTAISGVPRLYEKVQARILAAVSQAPALRQRLFHWAVATGHAYRQRQRDGQRIGLGLRLKHFLADRLVLSKLRNRMFGPNVRYMVSGGAPARMETMEFFHALGLLILEGYGLTETSAAATLNRLGDYRFGTVGKTLPGVEVRIADDGEVLIRSPGNFREYFKEPEATREAYAEDDWFKSGDLGSLDPDGFLRITGRKKDIIVTAGGKNIAPQNIEAKLEVDPRIGHAVVIGDKRPYLVALIFLDPDYDGEVSWEEVEAAVDQIIEATNATLARYETIKKFRLVDESLSIDDGTLTPTLKVKRNVVAERYAGLLDEMYAEPKAASG